MKLVKSGMLSALVFAFVVLATVSSAVGQAYQGGIRGRVADPLGAVAAQVVVTLTDETTKISRTAMTNGAGEYNFPTLEPGVYTVTIARPGFKVYEQKHLTVEAQQFQTIDATLEVGGKQ